MTWSPELITKDDNARPEPRASRFPPQRISDPEERIIQLVRPGGRTSTQRRNSDTLSVQ